MRLFKRKEPLTAAVQTAPATITNKHPFTVLDRYSDSSQHQWKLYKALKESVPIIDAAISKIIRLTGEFKIRCDDPEIEVLINKFIEEVPVGSCSLGANNFILGYLNQLITYGTAVGEIVLNSAGDNIEALYNASLEDLELKTETSPLNLKIYKKNKKAELSPIKCPELVIVSSLNPDPGCIYGNSVMKGLPFVSNILLKIYNSIGTNWERMGNVRFAVTYKPSSDAGDKAYAKQRASQIAAEWSKAMKSTDHPSDFIAVGDVGIKVIGADNQILDSQVPVRQMLEQIISKLSIPPFLLGLNWSTTETMSTQQAEILSNELEAYRRLLNPVIKKICDMWFRINGIQCNYKIDWNTIDLKDQVQIANARLTNARALEIEKRIQDS